MDLHSEAAWECITLESSWFIVLESKDVSWIPLFIVSVSVI